MYVSLDYSCAPARNATVASDVSLERREYGCPRFDHIRGWSIRPWGVGGETDGGPMDERECQQVSLAGAGDVSGTDVQTPPSTDR